MATIDLSSMSIRTVNEVIKGYGANHQDVELINPDARHYIAVGLTNPIKIKIRGSAGYFCGGLTDGPTIEVEKNVSWGVGDNMLAGSIVVGGNAGAIAGEALRGGEIVIKGNMGSRAGQVMKKGTLCCVGNSSFMAGYMMYGGRLIILGNSGYKAGEDMAGGAIFVGGTLESLGNDAMVCEPTQEDIDGIMEFLDRYGITFQGSFKKVVCAGKGLRYSKPEAQKRYIPFKEFSGGNAAYWNEKVQEDIRIKGEIGRYRIRGYGAARHIPHFQDIAFKADLSNAGKDADGLSRVNLRTFVGSKHGGRALDLSMPIMIAPMSYGAVSGKMKAALGVASRLSDISENTGEGGMYSVERAETRQLIAQCLSGRLGWNIHDMKRADALELYISQGAKPGLGGQLMASKLTPEIAEMRGIPAGMDLRSPSRHPDVLGGDDLIMKIQEFREAVGGRLPVGLKLGAGRTRDDIKIALKDDLDFVELDGLQGGTGAAAGEVLEYVGIPTIAAIMEARDGLAEIDAEGELPIVLMGGIRNGVDAAKAIALGATAVGLGTSMLIAAGCTGCMQCSTGNCPVGIATQNEEYTERFDVESKALRMHQYLESIRWQLASIVQALGYTNVRQLSRNDLVALTPEAAEMTRLPYDPDYRNKLKLILKESERFEKGKTETGSAGFSRRDRIAIQAMSRTDARNTEKQREIFMELLRPRENPFPENRPAHLDDLVFLSAALTRLVIDPYREECNTRTRISRAVGLGRVPAGAPWVDLAQPFLFTGFDAAPRDVKAALAKSLAETQCAYVGRRPLMEGTPGNEEEAWKKVFWFQVLSNGDRPHPEAAALVYAPGDTFTPMEMERQSSSQLLGMVANAKTLHEALPYALEKRVDFLVLDSSLGMEHPWVELKGQPDLTLLRDAIRLLRDMNREEEIALINFGGIRSGTDVAKVLALNCKASVFGVAAGIALGGRIEKENVHFDDSMTMEVRSTAMTQWIKGTAQEMAIIARCTGKTDIHNLEPEDMRSITLATSKALDIPLASGRKKREGF